MVAPPRRPPGRYRPYPCPYPYPHPPPRAARKIPRVTSEQSQQEEREKQKVKARCFTRSIFFQEGISHCTVPSRLTRASPGKATVSTVVTNDLRGGKGNRLPQRRQPNLHVSDRNPTRHPRNTTKRFSYCRITLQYCATTNTFLPGSTDAMAAPGYDSACFCQARNGRQPKNNKCILRIPSNLPLTNNRM